MAWSGHPDPYHPYLELLAMTNRLPYETRGGMVSKADTFTQLIEHLRLSEECAYMIGHLEKADDNELVGQGWLAIGEMLKLTIHNVTKLATKGILQ